MTNTIHAEGSCLCGSVKITANTLNTNAGACHCTMCRNWTGGPFITVDCGSNVSFEGEKNINRFNSSDWAERGFCNQCGTHLFYFLKEAQQYIVSAGLFKSAALAFDHQIFIDEKPDFYEFANKTKNMTGAEVFAAYAPPEE